MNNKIVKLIITLIINLILARMSIFISVYVNLNFLDKILDYFKIMSIFSHYCNLIVITIIVYCFLYVIIFGLCFGQAIKIDIIIKIFMCSYILFMAGILFGRDIPYEINSFNFKSNLPTWIYRMDILLVFYFIVGNIIVFVPLGFFISYIYGIKRGLLYSFFTILTIELSQGITKLGWFDIDDIILNNIGALFGWLALVLLLKLNILKDKSILSK